MLAEIIKKHGIRLYVRKDGSISTIYPASEHSPDWSETDHPVTVAARSQGAKSLCGSPVRCASWNKFLLETLLRENIGLHSFDEVQSALSGNDGSQLRQELYSIAMA